MVNTPRTTPTLVPTYTMFRLPGSTMTANAGAVTRSVAVAHVPLTTVVAWCSPVGRQVLVPSKNQSVSRGAPPAKPPMVVT